MTIKILKDAKNTKKLSVNWVQRFLFRQSYLIFVFNQVLNKERAVMYDKEIIKNWF